MRSILFGILVSVIADPAFAQQDAPPAASVTCHTFQCVNAGWGSWHLPSSASFSFLTGWNDNGHTDLFWVTSKLHVGSSTTMLGQINGGFSLFEHPKAVATWTLDMTDPPPSTSAAGEYTSVAVVEGKASTNSLRNDQEISTRSLIVP
jgi:hypothetical protein